MYIPKKSWMKWKKIISQNMIWENGKTIYRLGKDRWEEHCFEYSRAKKISQEQAGMEFPIYLFDYYWAYDVGYGTDYMLHDMFPYLFMKLKDGRVTSEYIYQKTNNRLQGLINELKFQSEEKTKRYFEEHPEMKEKRTLQEMFDEIKVEDNEW